MPRLLVSCGEPSGDLYGAELVRHLRERVAGLEVFGLGGDRLQAAGRVAARARPRPRRGRPARGASPTSAHLRRGLPARPRRGRPAPARRRGARRLSRLQPAAGPRAPPPRASPSSTTSRRRSGPGGSGRMRRHPRHRGAHARHLPVRGAALPRGGRAGDVRRPSAGGPGARRPRTAPASCARARPRPRAARGGPAAGKPAQGDRPQPAAARGRGRRCSPPRGPTCSSWPRWRRRSTRPLRAPRSRRTARSPLVHDRTHAVLSAATAAIVASGTATVEAALLGAPMVVVYRLSPLTYHLGRRFVRVPALRDGEPHRRAARRAGAHPVTTSRRSAWPAEILAAAGGTAARRQMRQRPGRSPGAARRPGASGRAAEAVVPFLAGKSLDTSLVSMRPSHVISSSAGGAYATQTVSWRSWPWPARLWWLATRSPRSCPAGPSRIQVGAADPDRRRARAVPLTPAPGRPVPVVADRPSPPAPARDRPRSESAATAVAAAAAMPPNTNRPGGQAGRARCSSSSATASQCRAPRARREAPVGCRIHLDCTPQGRLERAHQPARNPCGPTATPSWRQRRQHRLQPRRHRAGTRPHDFYADVDGVTVEHAPRSHRVAGSAAADRGPAPPLRVCPRVPSVERARPR